MDYHTRISDRQAVLKRAKLVYRDTVIDCLVTDQSASGARVRLGTVMLIPDRVTIHFPGGSAFDATRRWSRGTEIGLEFVGAATWSCDARVEALNVYESMRNRSFPPLQRLQDLNYFDDPGLRALAIETEAALVKLEAGLRSRAQVAP